MTNNFLTIAADSAHSAGLHPRTDASKRGPVFRSIAFPVDAFDHLKATQRHLAASFGLRLTLNATVAHVIAEHRRLTQGGAR